MVIEFAAQQRYARIWIRMQLDRISVILPDLDRNRIWMHDNNLKVWPSLYAPATPLPFDFAFLVKKDQILLID